jgi:hypothetical protein
MMPSDIAIADGSYELPGLAGGVSRSVRMNLMLKRIGKGQAAL